MTNRAESTYRNPGRTLKRIKMIKICYIIGQLTIGGAEKQLYELVRGINREKFQPFVISLSEGGYWSKEIQQLGIQLIEMRRKKNREFARLFKLIRLLRKIKPEIVHTYLFPANSYGRIASILSKVPVIIASERNLPELGKDKNIYKICIDRILAPFTGGIICNSYRASDSLRKYFFNKEKVFTVHNGVNGNVYSSKNIKNEDRSFKVIGTIGRLCPQKNQRLFLDVAKTVIDKSENKKIKFMIVGEGALKNDLENYSIRLGIERNVVFTGERSDIIDLLQSMDIFVMTSVYEGLSNTIMEAMSAGLPVVATDVGGNNELVVNGETGFLCPLNDTAAISDKVIRLLNNIQEAKQMGENGGNRIMGEFKIEKMVRETEHVYATLIKQFSKT
jgi:glycosyltransferase involved in cell wall biosynthesis